MSAASARRRGVAMRTRADDGGLRITGSIQPIPGPVVSDPVLDVAGTREFWTCPRCGHSFVSANLWHSCSRHTVDAHFERAEPPVRAAFEQLVELYERCGPIVVIAQKTRIVFMVRVRFGGCVVRRDRLLTAISLPRRVDHARWTRVEELAPGWIAHHMAVREPAELSDPELASLICESYHEIGEQGRLHRTKAPSEHAGPAG